MRDAKLTGAAMRHRLLNDPSSSLWLKRAIRETEGRDLVEALEDAEKLTEMLKALYDEQVAKYPPSLIRK